VVGELELSYERFQIAADAGQMIVAYAAEPGSKSAETFGLLASWAATEETGSSERVSASVEEPEPDEQ